MFNVENRLWSSLSRLVDIVGLSLLWLALSLPVVTAGPASAALYYTVVKSFRYGEESTFRTMLRAFRNNLKKGIPVSIITAAAVIAIGFGYTVMAQNRSSDIGNVLYCIYCAAMMLPGCMLCCLFPVMARFENGVFQLFANAFYLTLAHIPTMVLLALVTYGTAIWSAAAFFPLFFVPTLLALISSYPLERIFARHISEEEKEKLQRRADTVDDEDE